LYDTAEYRNIIQENARLHTKVSVLEEQLENVQRQLAWLKKQIFGRKTEQASVIMADGIQLSLLNEEISETEDKSENNVAVPAHTRKKRRTHDEWMHALEIKKEFHKVENMVCEKCGAPMKVIGEDQAYDELVVTSKNSLKKTTDTQKRGFVLSKVNHQQ